VDLVAQAAEGRGRPVRPPRTGGSADRTRALVGRSLGGKAFGKRGKHQAEGDANGTHDGQGDQGQHSAND
jgi:hypothetical protein